MRSFATLLTTTLLAPAIPAAGINDTGQTSCYDASHEAVVCSASVGGDAGVHPRQDARYGRDAQALAGTLTKTGGGAAGFDFTKIANDGSALAATAVLGTGDSDWACTKDNVTGLTWEVKTTAGLRRSNHVYTWYSTDASNGGNPGDAGTNTCGGTLSAAPYNNQCNTRNFIAAVNAATLCGAADWRLPTLKELLSLVHSGEFIPAIDAAYFPNTVSDFYWTSSTYVFGLDKAWFVTFYDGDSDSGSKVAPKLVRLVRGGQ